MTDTWQPLLEGPPAAAAWRAIEDLAEALRTADPAVRATHQGLRGAIAEALFFAYLAEARGDGGGAADVETSAAFLEAAIEALGAQASLPMLYGGFVGVGWVVEHLRGRVFADGGEDDGEDGGEDDGDQAIDDYLLAALPRGARVGDFDLISGLTGVGVYALEALPRPAGRRILELVVDRLEEIASEPPGKAGGALAWFTPADRLPDYQRRATPDGHFNLGVAHGVPGPAALLALIGAAGVDSERCAGLAERAISWLLSQRHGDEDWRFESWTASGAPPEPSRRGQPSRLGWCYGDPGMAAVLLGAARAQGRADWREAALDIGHAAARRDPASSEVEDPALCHGAAGLAHLFNRLHQASHDDALARAARFWFERALEMRRPGQGIGGFLCWLPDESGRFDWRPQPDFLTGAAGIGLALLGAVSPVEPAWDRLLLCS